MTAKTISIKIYLYTCVVLWMLLPSALPAHEALKSVEEEYYDFLALQGLIIRPTLNYRTFSDSAWAADEAENHPWQQQNMGAFFPLFGDVRLQVYGPELFLSGNTAAPYGQNDGVLWQGRGFNAFFTAGLRIEGYGVELTLKPHLAFSQNAAFDIMPSAYDSEYGYFWRYGKNAGADAPQRFGSKPFFDWDLGDSEIRYTWKTLTIGFGTQAIWLGPSYLNSMIHSNNAPAYPKFDLGLRRQSIIVPLLGWYLGDVEARFWVGRLSESDYFDSNDSNNHTMFHGLSFAYAPPFLPGLTLFANRVCLVPWAWENLKFIFPSKENTIEDQKASFGFSWVFPQVGFEVYGELGFDDFIPDRDDIRSYIRYPFHTMLYTVGFKKSMPIMQTKNIYGTLFFEWNCMEISQDFQFQWAYSPYFHHQITQGYTNRGQWLGAGTGWGGNSQYLGFRLYYPKGSSMLFLHRNNPDNNFLFKEAISASASKELEYAYFKSWKANFALGLETNYFLSNSLSLGGGFVYNLIINPHYYLNKTDTWVDNYLNNFSLHLSIRLYL